MIDLLLSFDFYAFQFCLFCAYHPDYSRRDVKKLDTVEMYYNYVKNLPRKKLHRRVLWFVDNINFEIAKAGGVDNQTVDEKQAVIRYSTIEEYN